MNSPSERIEALEKSLARAVAGAPAALESIAKRQAHAESVIESFADDPAPEKLDKVYQAHNTVAIGRTLLERFSDLKVWKARLESAWITSNQPELVVLLESLVAERAAHRQAYMEASATELGRLTVELANADTSNEPDSTLTRLNSALAAVEDDRASREAKLRIAQDALRSFQRAREMVNAYESLYAKWRRARDAAVAVDFTISGA